ncbi:MAG TPA: VOC family protein [Candidatus Kryptonia bacterium]
MKRVTGIGGVFFKCENPATVLEWYNKHLGISPVGIGTVFEWREKEDPGRIGHSVLAFFDKDNEYFLPGKKEFMLNYRVEEIETLIEQLRSEGVEIAEGIETYDYGKFAWIIDPEGNKIELWEPNDMEFRKANGLKD